jgi:ferredoxin-NADP reductase
LLSFLVVYIIFNTFLHLGNNSLHSIYIALGFSPILFFGTIMLTEPMTAPVSKNKRIAYGALAGIITNPLLHIGGFYFSPEVGLLIANIFSYLSNLNKRYRLTLLESRNLGSSIKEFIFSSDKKIEYWPGQYMEWTLPVSNSDARGNRRYFTLASSPTENTPRLGVRFYPEPSTFKKTLEKISVGQKIFAGQISGEFTLPKDKNQKLVFLAGGIGVTPFRSMTKYLIDRSDKRDIVHIYSNRFENEIAYKDIFNEGERVGVKTIYTLTESKDLPSGWSDETGFIDEAMIKRNVPDYLERIFYISGSHAMVTVFKEMLQKMGVEKRNIKTDFFPGLV